MLGEAAPPYPWESRQQRPQCPGAFPNLVQVLQAFKLAEEFVVSPAETEALCTSGPGLRNGNNKAPCCLPAGFACHTFSIGKCVGKLVYCPINRESPILHFLPLHEWGVLCHLDSREKCWGKSKRCNPGSICRWDQESIFLTP